MADFPTRTLDSILSDSDYLFPALTLTGAAANAGAGDTDDTATIQAFLDSAGALGSVVIPPGNYYVPGDLFINQKGNVNDKGSFRIEATGVQFTGAGKVIVNSCKRVILSGLEAPTHSLCLRGAYFNDFFQCRFKELLLQDQSGTVFTACYWNNFFGGGLQRIATTAGATNPSNALFFFGTSLRGDATQGFASSFDFAIELNANQNAQNWVFFGGDISYYANTIYSVGAGNTTGDIELVFDKVYFDTDYPSPLDRANGIVKVIDCHVAGRATNIFAKLAAIVRGKHGAHEKTHTSGWEPYVGFNFIANGDFAKESASWTGVGNPIGNAGGATLAAVVAAGSLMGRYLKITQAATTANAVTFRSAALPFAGKYSGQLILRNGADANPKNLRVSVGGLASDVVVDGEWTYVSLASNTARTVGQTLDIIISTNDGTAFDVEVCYAGAVLGTAPPVVLPQWTPNFKQDDAYATRFRPGSLAATRPIWTSGNNVPAFAAPRGSFYGQENGNLAQGLWGKFLNADATGWYPLMPILSGTTAERPTRAVGLMYFDTTLNKPIWGGNGNWVDATGTTV